MRKNRSYNEEESHFYYFLDGRYYDDEVCRHAISEHICNEFDWQKSEMFSGITDKNGNEIYEGDIIEVLDSQNRPCRHIVRFSDHRGGYVQYLYMAEDIIVEPFDAGLLWQQYIIEQGKYVIGNIHDNPELFINK